MRNIRDDMCSAIFDYRAGHRQTQKCIASFHYIIVDL